MYSQFMMHGQKKHCYIFSCFKQPLLGYFPPWRKSPSGPGPPHYRGFTITLTTHNTHKRQT